MHRQILDVGTCYCSNVLFVSPGWERRRSRSSRRMTFRKRQVLRRPVNEEAYRGYTSSAIYLVRGLAAFVQWLRYNIAGHGSLSARFRIGARRTHLPTLLATKHGPRCC
jgi:hypothetical protein